MKPWYHSKKLWAAIVTGVANLGATAAMIYIGKEQMAMVTAATISAIGMALIGAFGLADQGKEAAALKGTDNE